MSLPSSTTGNDKAYSDTLDIMAQTELSKAGSSVHLNTATSVPPSTAPCHHTVPVRGPPPAPGQNPPTAERASAENLPPYHPGHHTTILQTAANASGECSYPTLEAHSRPLSLPSSCPPPNRPMNIVIVTPELIALKDAARASGNWECLAFLNGDTPEHDPRFPPPYAESPAHVGDAHLKKSNALLVRMRGKPTIQIQPPAPFTTTPEAFAMKVRSIMDEELRRREVSRERHQFSHQFRPWSGYSRLATEDYDDAKPLGVEGTCGVHLSRFWRLWSCRD